MNDRPVSDIKLIERFHGMNPSRRDQMPGEHVGTTGWGNNAKESEEWKRGLDKSVEGDETRFFIGRIRDEMEKAEQDAIKSAKMKTMNISAFDLSALIKRLDKAERFNKEAQVHINEARKQRDEALKSQNKVRIAALAFCLIFALACLVLTALAPEIFRVGR